jgi:fibronectin type 3 domain-containing protein
LELKRPDIIPYQDKTVETGETYIYQVIAESNTPLKLYESTTENSYTDKELSPEKTFRYRIKAQYDDGTSSGLSNEITVKM